MTELYGVRDNDSFGVGVDNLEAAVVRWGWTNVEAVSASKGPRCPLVGFVVNDDRAAAWADWCCIEVEWSIEMLPGGDVRIEP